MFETENRSSHPMLSYTDSLATGAQDFILLAARVLGGVYFAIAGWGKIMGLSGFVAGQVKNGVPTALAYIAPFAEFLGGVALVIGFATRYAALGLFLFTVIATYLAHLYWTYPEAQQAMQRGQFWKNVTIMGGQLALFVTGAGRISVDNFLRR